MDLKILARKLFSAAVRGPLSLEDIGRVAALVSVEDDPDAGLVEHILGQLDHLGTGCHADLAVHEPHRQLGILASYIHEQQGFVGNVSNYYDPSNSLLGKVLARRTGIPLTLGLVYMEVARRRGVPLVPIGLPGHLVIRHAVAEDAYLDPFSGDVLTEQACLDRVLGMKRYRLMPQDLLNPMTAQAFLTRLLANLKGAYLQAEPPDIEHAFGACERILLVNPDLPAEVRDRGLLNLHRGDHRGALHDLERYLLLRPDAPDLQQVTHYVQTLYHVVANLN